MPEYYYVETEGRNTPGARRAIDLATQLARPGGDDVLFLSPTKQGLPHSTLAHIYDRDQIRLLLGGGPFKVKGVPVRYASTATFKPLAERGVIVAFWPGQPMFAKLDRVDDCRALIVVPWTPSFCDGWRERHNPTLVPVGAESPGPAPQRPGV